MLMKIFDVVHTVQNFGYDIECKAKNLKSDLHYGCKTGDWKQVAKDNKGLLIGTAVIGGLTATLTATHLTIGTKLVPYDKLVAMMNAKWNTNFAVLDVDYAIQKAFQNVANGTVPYCVNNVEDFVNYVGTLL